MLLEERVGQLLLARRYTLAVAESCTGGLVGHRLTNIAGSSAYFLGGVVAYAYDAKERLLDVNHNTLYDFGAVSEQTAREMARGVRRALGADVGVSVTGIAGPSGGLPGKPVGLTWVALSAREVEIAEQYLWTGDRVANKERSAEAVLEMVVAHLESLGANS
jgi:PncC family amidohydrolase